MKGSPPYFLGHKPMEQGMTEELKENLRLLAERFETTDFKDEDPSQFMTWYSSVREQEAALFITAMLSFGNRKQFIPKIRMILDCADRRGGICEWLTSGAFETDFCGKSDDAEKFYRFYSYTDLKALFRALQGILRSGSLGERVRHDYKKRLAHYNGMPAVEKAAACATSVLPAEIICGVFADLFADCAIVPRGKNSANKRLHMFLRWMVRRNSPVDLGLWTWYSPSDLIIPLDTHVLQEARRFGMVGDRCPASFRTAVLITNELKKIWQDDPCKGDFALFGLGVL